MDGPDPIAPVLRGRKGEIVALLSSTPRMSVAQLGNALGLTPGGVRQQLAQLESAGLIAHQEGAGGRGRFFYSLAPATSHTQVSYHRFIVRLLHAIDDHEQGAIELAASRIGICTDLDAAAPLASRLHHLRALFEEEGFEPRLEFLEDRAILRMGACPIRELAAEFPSLCEAELGCLLKALGPGTARALWGVEGNAECAYLVSAPQETTPNLNRRTAQPPLLRPRFVGPPSR